MKELSVLGIICLSLFIFSCEKDEYDNSQTTDQTEDINLEDSATINFEGRIYEEFKLWIAGEEIDTEGLDVYDYIAPDAYDNMILEDDVPVHFEFDEDSVNVLNSEGITTTVAYHFSNDSLYIETNTIAGEIIFGHGSQEELKLERGFLFAAKYAFGMGPQSHGTRSFPYHHYTFENTSSFHNYETLADMSEIDTLVIYNQTFLYD